ncbi:MAG: type II toxin-antitoxin system VapC family toxin, partial [Acidimicrobiia bacterium]
MKIVFADTGYWVAVLNPKDDWNTRANEVSRSLGKVRIVTTEMVLAELPAALSKVSVRPMAVQGVESICT